MSIFARDIVSDAADISVCDSYIGVYWTFPAPGRETLPSDPREAEAISYTIAQQRREIGEQARLQGLACVGEFALQFDHYGFKEADRRHIREIEKICERGDTVVIHTNFKEAGNWRRNAQLDLLLKNAANPFVSVESPTEAVIEHFEINRHWDNMRRQNRSNLRARTRSPVRVSKAMLPKFYAYMATRCAEILDCDALPPSKLAATLNGRGLHTISGRAWDDDSVRALRRQPHFLDPMLRHARPPEAEVPSHDA